MPAQPLTKQQLQESARLESMFKQWQFSQREIGNRETSQEKVAARMGFGQSAFNQYLKGNIPLNPEAATKFAELLECAISDFSPSIAKKIQRFGIVIPSHPDSPNSGTDNQDDVEIPQYDAGGGMGIGKLLLDGQPGIIKNWHVDHEWIRQNVRNHTGIDNLCIVTGFGPSMRPMFNPGDPLLVDRGVTTAELDAIYFFWIGKHGFIKTLQRIPKGNDVILRAKSKNPDYDPFDIDESMDFQVLGRVLTIWKSEQF